MNCTVIIDVPQLPPMPGLDKNTQEEDEFDDEMDEEPRYKL